MTHTNTGWLYGFIGVVIFAGSLPATRLGVIDFSPEFMTFARASIAGIIGLALLIYTHQKKPNKPQLKSLFLTGCGVVVGFPLLTAFALETISSARAIVFIGMLPLSTAIFAVLRANEKPKPLFWLFAVLGSLCVALFMLTQSSDHLLHIGDVYMIAAILICGLGYAEGGQLAKELGGWQVICWALALYLPVMLLFSIFTAPTHLSQVSNSSILSLLYVALFSSLIGFYFWYKGLALGGIAQVGQIQLVQPFLGFVLSACLLHETISLQMIMVSFAVIICVAFAKRYA